MRNNVRYWLLGEHIQNFGDFLSEFFMEELFYNDGLRAHNIRIIGSCIDDGLLGGDPLEQEEGLAAARPVLSRPVFWGCGLRHEHSLSEANRETIDVLAVRGPLSRSALRLGETVPIGDPGLLLPALYQPSRNGRPTGTKSLLVPHFLDRRSDDELLALSGCDAVLRPNLPNDLVSLTDFIDRLVAAEFVLSGSLHAAIAAAAYDRAFAFWDSGAVDLPFKWQDFALSVAIPCAFQPTLAEAEAYYAQHVQSRLAVPVLWPLLLHTPFPVRADAFAKVVQHDVARHGLAALDADISARGARRLHDASLERALEVERAKVQAKAQTAQLTRERDAARAEAAAAAATLTAAQAQLRAAERDRATAEAQTAELTREHDAARTEAAAAAAALTAAQAQLRAAERDRATAEAQAAELTCKHDAVRGEAAAALTVAQAQVQAARQESLQSQQARDAVIYSTSWRLLHPLRAVGIRYPWLARGARRSVKFVWWTVTLQLGHRYALWRRHQKARKAATPKLEAPPKATPGPIQEKPAAKAPAWKAPVAAPPDTDATGVAVPLSLSLRDAFLAWHGTAAIYFPPVMAPKVSVIIPVYRGLADVACCLRSLAVHRGGGPGFEVILVDDCPAEPVLWAIPDSGGLVKVANEENLGFLLTCNRGAAVARGQIFCFLNSDTIVSEGWLASLVEALDDVPDAALVGSMLLNADGTIQDAGWRILSNGWGHPIGRDQNPNDGSYTYRRPVDCVTGACFAVPRARWDALGGLDPLYAPAFYEEFDFALRARARGWQVIYEPRSRIVHLGSASYGPEQRDRLSTVNQAKFRERFAAVLPKHPWDTADEFVLRHAAGEGPVLLVVDYGVPHPDRHAGDVTMSRYLALLAGAGWRVVFGPMNGHADGPAATWLERQGIELIRSPCTIEQWLAAHGEHVREAWLARPDIAERMIPPLRTHTQARIAYYTHDLHHMRLEREAELHDDAALRVEAARVRAQECAVFASVDHITSPSTEEARAIRAISPGAHVTVLPPYFYEASEITARSADHFACCNDIVFVGGFPHTPNVDAALFIVRAVMPLVWQECPHARLVLVGYAPPPEVQALAGPRVIVTGQVAAVEPFFDQARVLLAALRYGAGVKGKTVEALRQGVPVVATPIGVEGIGAEAGHEAIVGETADALAAGVLELFRSPERCQALSAAGSDLARRRFSRCAARTAIGEVFRTPRCGVCGSGQLLAPASEGNFREAFVCRNCFALARAEALARVVLDRVARDGEASLVELAKRRPDLRVHEFGFVGGIADALRGQSWYSMSEYFEDIEPGTCGPAGVRCEDLTRLSFDDESFDIVISQDVMEHVSDPLRGFAETARVLRPGGSHIFTIPHNRALARSVTRATLGAHGINHLLPPEYHGDPVRAEGALVFTDFGADLGTMLAAAGLELIEHELTVPGGSPEHKVHVFEAVKPASRHRISHAMDIVTEFVLEEAEE